MQYYKSSNDMQKLTDCVSVPKSDYISRTMGLYEKAQDLNSAYLYSAKELIGEDDYKAIMDQYGVLFELFVDDMIERGYVPLRCYQLNKGVQGKLYAFDPYADYGGHASDYQIPDTPLNRLLLDVE